MSNIKDKTISIGKYEIETKKLAFLLLHLTIIIAFTVQILYSIITFATVASAGSGTAGLEAGAIPFEEMVTRRLYAIELWIAVVGLAVYLAVVYKNKLANLFSKKAITENAITQNTITENAVTENAVTEKEEV